MLNKTLPIKDWHTTVIEPIIVSAKEALVAEGMIPNLPGDRYKLAPRNMETVDTDDTDNDEGIMIAETLVHLTYDHKETRFAGVGFKPTYDGIYKIIEDTQGGFVASTVNNTYKIIIDVEIHTHSKNRILEYVELLNRKISTGKYLLNHKVYYNWNLPPSLVEYLDIFLAYRNAYDLEVSELNKARVEALNALPPGDPDKPERNLIVEEPLRPLEMHEFLTTISTPMLRSRFDKDINFREPMIIQNHYDVLARIGSGEIEPEKTEPGTYRVAFTYEIELELPRFVNLSYPIVVYNNMVEDKLLPKLPDVPDNAYTTVESYLQAERTRYHKFKYQNTDYDMLVRRMPEEDIYPIPKVHAYKPISSTLVNIDLTDRKALFNLNQDTDMLVDLHVKGWLQRGEMPNLIEPYESGIYVALVINEQITFGMLEIDNDFNVRSKVDLSPKNTYRVVVYLLSDLRAVNISVLKNMWKCPYIWLLFVDIWYYFRSISFGFWLYLKAITPRDLTGQWETEPRLLRTLLGGTNPLEEIYRLEWAGLLPGYIDCTVAGGEYYHGMIDYTDCQINVITEWSYQYNIPFDITKLPAVGWISTFLLGGCGDCGAGCDELGATHEDTVPAVQVIL